MSVELKQLTYSIYKFPSHRDEIGGVGGGTYFSIIGPTGQS